MYSPSNRKRTKRLQNIVLHALPKNCVDSKIYNNISDHIGRPNYHVSNLYCSCIFAMFPNFHAKTVSNISQVKEAKNTPLSDDLIKVNKKLDSQYLHAEAYFAKNRSFQKSIV